MAASTGAAATGSSARNFSQVVFVDIPHSYPPSAPVTCSYTLTDAFKPNSRDWVGIFKVGWSTTKDYHTFVWAEPSLDVGGQQPVTRQAVFRDYYLPKDEIDFYQFCYVDSNGQVRGASTPFCFRSQAEQSMESHLDDDLLVITTQEQVDQSVREKAQLQTQMDQIMKENESLKQALQNKQQEITNMKEQNEKTEKEKILLVKEVDQLKAERENLKSSSQQQLKEMDQSKEKLVQMTKQMELQEQDLAELKQSQSSGSDEASKQMESLAQQKYDRALIKINQLKDERQELRNTVDAQSEEISTLNFKIREKDRELFKVRDSIQLLQVDLQSTEKEKERLSTELKALQGLENKMEDMKREKQELSRRLSQQETQQNAPDEDLRARCQTLASQLQEAQAKLADQKELCKNSQRRAETLEGDVHQLKKQLEGLNASFERAQQQDSKKEMLLREAHGIIADKDSNIEEKERLIQLVTQDKDELVRENQNLTSEIEELRRACERLQAAPTAESSYMQPDAIPTAGNPRTPEPDEHFYHTIRNPEEEQSLVCRLCHESFPSITPEELEAHEQSHRICPFCALICDGMEQSIFEDHVYGHEL